MKKLIRPVMASATGNEPYDDEMWYTRNNELCLRQIYLTEVKS